MEIAREHEGSFTPISSGQYTFSGMFGQSFDGGEAAHQSGFFGNMDVVESPESGLFYVLGTTTEKALGRGTIQGQIFQRDGERITFRKKYVGRDMEQSDYDLTRVDEQLWAGSYFTERFFTLCNY